MDQAPESSLLTSTRKRNRCEITSTTTMDAETLPTWTPPQYDTSAPPKLLSSSELVHNPDFPNNFARSAKWQATSNFARSQVSHSDLGALTALWRSRIAKTGLFVFWSCKSVVLSTLTRCNLLTSDHQRLSILLYLTQVRDKKLVFIIS